MDEKIIKKNAVPVIAAMITALAFSFTGLPMDGNTSIEKMSDVYNGLGCTSLLAWILLLILYVKGWEGYRKYRNWQAHVLAVIVSAGMLAFVVLYNLNSINITERQRELATLKVLGFYDVEVAEYVFRENILLTLIGAFVGVIFGKVLHLFVIQTVEVDAAMFGRSIYLPSYIYSFLFTIGFSLFVNWVMYFKLKKIDMVESLKSIE